MIFCSICLGIGIIRETRERRNEMLKWALRGGDKQSSSKKTDVLVNETLKIERKFFTFEMKENDKGKFLRITEEVGGRRDTIIIPATGLKEVRDIIDSAISSIS